MECTSVFQPCSKQLKRRKKFAWISPRSTLGVTLLALLTIPAPLEAQTSQNLLSGSPKHSVRELRDDNVLRTRDIGFSFDCRETSTALAVEGVGPATAVSTEASHVEPPAVLIDPCPSATSCADWYSVLERLPRSVGPQSALVVGGDKIGEDSKLLSVETSRPSKPADFNQSIYYKNKFEFGLDVGWLPVNIPFVFDFLLGDGYTMTPLKYTLVPIIASVRWQMDDVGGPRILRGNWDLSFSGSVTVIPRGPETRYFAYIMGIRRNFVQRNWRLAPYFDGRLGLGNIDAKGPKGVAWAQGQDFTFTLNLGSGVRYNFNPRYSVSAGMNYMHISNLYLSEPRYGNYGINVYGPMVGIDVQLGKHQTGTSQ
jgi:hypothetical protein